MLRCAACGTMNVDGSSFCMGCGHKLTAPTPTPAMPSQPAPQREVAAPAILGIDLGTTYSCIAMLDEMGNPVLGTNQRGGASTPSVVHFPQGREPSECEVGQVAKDSAETDPDRVAQLFKPNMGKPGAVAVTVDGIDVSPTEASAHVLRKMTQDFSARYGAHPAGVVITVPAHFGQQEREATVTAGEIAGLNVVGIVQEPIAAAVFYGACESDEDSDVLVYDLGGGTFDVTAVSIRHRDGRHLIDVVCAEGDHELGGRLWDDRVVDYLADAYCSQAGPGQLSSYARQTLRTVAEEAKKRLSRVEGTAIEVSLDRGPAHMELTRDMFDALTSDLLANSIGLTRRALENARSKGCNPSKFLLVGGSTWMPQVERALQREFPGIPLRRVDPVGAVAKGAAICAALQLLEKAKRGEIPADVTQKLARPLAGFDGSEIDVGFVTSKSYGVKATFQDGVERISNIIVKNSRIDRSGHELAVTRDYYTLAPYPQQMSVELEVYESDEEASSTPLAEGRMVVAQSFDLSEFRLPANSTVSIEFSLNDEGLLSVTAKEGRTGNGIRFRKKVMGLTREEKEQARARVTGLRAG